jgi:alpha-beta hydrolase superfamily lysophospholipase
LAECTATFSVETHAAGDGYRWQYRRYPAASAAPRAHVVCLHGIQSHAGWYEHSSTRLSQAGYNVYFLDRRGSGMNEQDRGDTPSFRRLVDDVAEFIRPFRQPRTGSGAPVPLFLAGISWGGKLAVALQRRHPGLVEGFALLCPGICPRVRPALRQRLRIVGARLTAPRRLFPIPLNDPELFTASPEWQQFLRTDPLSLHQATARLLVESVRLDLYLRRCPPHVRVPVLLLLAEHDRIIDNAATRRFVERFATNDKTIIEYPGAHHTLEFEPEPDTFIRDLLHWLERHASP